MTRVIEKNHNAKWWRGGSIIAMKFLDFEFLNTQIQKTKDIFSETFKSLRKYAEKLKIFLK